MTRQDGFRGDAAERPQARERLETAQRQERQSSDRYEAASGGPSRLEARAELLEAGEQVAAREAWVAWVERDR